MEKGKYFKSIVKGGAFALLLSFICVVVLSGVMVKITFDKSVYNVIYVVISLAGLSIGSIIGAKKNGCRGWLVGAGVALCYYIILYLICSIISGTWSLNSFEGVKLVCCIIVGILSGMLGINL